jgi:hypothetical protein
MKTLPAGRMLLQLQTRPPGRVLKPEKKAARNAWNCLLSKKADGDEHAAEDIARLIVVRMLALSKRGYPAAAERLLGAVQQRRDRLELERVKLKKLKLLEEK